MADEFGVRYLQAIGPYDCPLEQAVDGFGQLCDRAAEHGLLVGIEWLPYTNIATAADAQAIVRARAVRTAATASTSGTTRAAPTTCRMIAPLEPDRVFAIQMNDGTLAPTARRLQDRLPRQPGRAG